MYWAPVRMKCKGSAECSMLCKNLKPEFNHLYSAIQNLSHAHMTAHILTPPPALLQILSRPAFNLQNIKTQSWRLVSRGFWLKRAQSACYQMPVGDQVKSVNTGDKLQLQLPAAASPVWLFQWGQWPQPHPVVAPSCKIGCFHLAANYLADYVLSVSLNPKPVNSRKKPISTHSPVTHNSDNISKRGRTGRIWAVGLVVFTWFDSHVSLGDKGPAKPFIIIWL